VSTLPLVAYAIASRIKVFVPVADYEKGILFHAELKDLSRVKYDGKGIMIPDNSDVLINESSFQPDMVFCPGIAFDLKGVRIGHGEGYYDRFLSKLKGAVKIGLAFEVQIYDELPVEPHDVLMDYIITEERIIQI
jgi:5-formyltetrahydrofolate cyclo-ligase